MSFRDPAIPIATCKEPDCAECPAADAIHCHFRPVELLQFLLVSLPPFLVGGAAVLATGWVPLALYIAVVISFFGFVEIRVMCSHCPHYAEDGATLQCWANHGSLKLWKYRPGPMSATETMVFFTGFVVVWGFPIAFFVINERWWLLGLYALLTSGFFMTLKMFLCSQCMNFACPLNGVSEEARTLFFAQNPTVAEAWKDRQT